MIEKEFLIQSFDKLEVIPITLKLVGKILSIEYNLEEISGLSAFKERDRNRSRKDNLWKDNCFEFFYSQKDCPGYTEYNIAPNGDWNCYTFSDYRRNMSISEVIKIPDITFYKKQVTAKFWLKNTKAIEIQVCSILRINDKLRYFALKHNESKPDFHIRKLFTNL